jgi:flavin reductase (DIM6/NTAB) family NADH-FMN oxidoreductase RutF
MDLIGPTDSPWFSMALRLTSPAVELMRQSRRMALASVPFSHKEVAYRLGEHHRKASIDWSSLPFPLEPSPQFHLPVAQAALRTREVQVEEFHTVGSHMLFLTSLVSETHREPHHTHASEECSASRQSHPEPQHTLAIFRQRRPFLRLHRVYQHETRDVRRINRREAAHDKTAEGVAHQHIGRFDQGGVQHCVQLCCNP